MGFEKLDLHADIIKAVKKSGFVEPTAIQKRCIPEIKNGKDVVGQSLTGSGKTAAFGLPIIEKIVHGKGIQALVLTPTRELAVQVQETLRSFASFMKVNVIAVYGGVSIQPQADALRKAEIVVATPGRMLDHINRKNVNFSNTRFLVLDESDKMFEMGLIEDVEEIIRQLPKERQTLLFSATMSNDIQHLIKKHLRNPIVIKEQVHVDKSLLKQFYYEVQQREKFSLLVHLLKNKTPGLAIVFCGTRREVDIVSRNLRLNGLKTMAVHGGLSQNKRSFAIDSLKKENVQVLVATDVAARGLDINNISHIYNYDSPKTSSEYIHRIGRTARAGKYGEAVTLLSDRDYDNFRNVLSDRSIQIQKEQIPEFQRVNFVREIQRSRDSFQRRDSRPSYSKYNMGSRNSDDKPGNFKPRLGSSKSRDSFRTRDNREKRRYNS
ncbi:DEAD/DEAH box helicase [Candidatus Woesearchaeota archaeon]|nr:DEAD/DEAH box helicase [Candidatus Woesearchaeota archaeon]